MLVSAVAPRAFAACGDGTINPGEDCDDGASNGTTNSCCDATCHFNGNSPDVYVGVLTGVTSYTPVGGISAYSIGTTSCNQGSCWLNWISNTAEHPVIGQNMFRLKDGRFEQIGQSWLKHGFTALQQGACFSDCNAAPNGSHLGVHCSDPYDSGLNGTQTRLGPKDDVNAFTGVYLYPDSRESTTGNSIFKRLQVHNTDIDPAQNAGALYFAEGQYVSHDDATASNNTNNASYRPCTFTGTGTFTLTLTGSTVTQKAGIQAWKAQDPSVSEVIIDADQGRFILSAKATSLGGGMWHYEYALQNLTNQRAGKSFTVPIPAGTTVSNTGFHDVDYHSGDPYDGTDWTPTVQSTSVSWAMVVVQNPANSNALRWGTLYNFRFDANVGPGTGSVTIGLWRAGQPTTATALTVVPSPCASGPDGTPCDDGNACTVGDTCSSGVCSGGAPVVCAPLDQCHSAGSCNPVSGTCSNPNRPDGTPCDDSRLCTTADVCVSGACSGTPVVCSPIDACHDAGTCNAATGSCSTPAKPDGTPCDDGNSCTAGDQCTSGTCAGTGPLLPADVGDGVMLSQSNGVTTISWTPSPGSATSSVLRGLLAQLPVGPGGGDEVCLDSGNASGSSLDPQDPPSDGGFWYLVRGVNACGDGTYGYDDDSGAQGPARQSTTCP
ncbi:MAG TPA: hypothetical protein VFV19_08550 [Candidatus Polarisedimenticolaceae bacterium]|nr:hypothetical protein [Candidatus Polarisedimenticolaceae bacterium]